MSENADRRDGRRQRHLRGKTTRVMIDGSPDLSMGSRPSPNRVGMFAKRYYCATCGAKKRDGRCQRCWADS